MTHALLQAENAARQGYLGRRDGGCQRGTMSRVRLRRARHRAGAALVKGFALAMSKLVLSGDADEVVNMARSNLRNLPRP